MQTNEIEVINSDNDIDAKYKFLERQISDLQNQFRIVDKYEYGKLVNYSQNHQEPYHGWFKYKEGYAADLVKNILTYFEYKKGDRVLDPFCGSGTTLLESKILGLSSAGFDVNPVSAFIAESKLCNYSKDDLLKIKKIIENFHIDNGYDKDNIPKLSILDKIFKEQQLKDILSLREFIQKYKGENIYFILKVAYLSIIESVSNMKKDGNGIKYLKNPNPEDVTNAFIYKVKAIVNDIENNINTIDINQNHCVINDSFLNVLKYDKFEKNSFNHIIFSPPYANCFDYCAVYKMELWMGDFVEDYKDFKVLRKKAIRSHVNGSVDPNIVNEHPMINWISDELKKFDLWDKKIPTMLKGYFDDMAEVLKLCYQLLDEEGNCAIVVANSSYKGFVVPTDLILAEIASQIGFEVREIQVCRPLRTSSQQANMSDELKQYLRESNIILKKKEN